MCDWIRPVFTCVTDNREAALTAWSVVVCSEVDAVFLAPAWEKKEGENRNPQLGLRFPEVCEWVRFIAKEDAFFSTVQILGFSWIVAWIRRTLLTHDSLCSPPRPEPERQLRPRSAATAFPQCSADEHTLTPQPHVNFGDHTKVGPRQRSSWEGDSWDNKKTGKTAHRNSKHTRLQATLWANTNDLHNTA